MLQNDLTIPSNKSIMECVANFSEGKNKSIIEKIANSIANTPHQKLLHIDTSPSANRTVMTFAGEPEAVTEAAYNAIKTAANLIDMSQQKGTHPRIGATDVCPFVPLHNMTINEAVAWANNLGKRVGTELGIPVYLYEYNASKEYRKSLPNIRKGQYEGIINKVFSDDWQPDFWNEAKDLKLLSKTGATVIGARKILVAFNISLDTKDEKIATAIAQRMRSSGYKEKLPNGNIVHHKGLLPELRAIGWYLDDFKHAQVSMNLLDYKTTSPLKVVNLCKALADSYGVSIIGSELIGLIPFSCIEEAGKYTINKKNKENRDIILEGIEYLQLNNIKPFKAEEHILEYRLKGLNNL